MISDEKLSKIENVANGVDPCSRVKVEKRNCGLYERVDGGVTILTEDNKMLLND